jgi:hypothetical protein
MPYTPQFFQEKLNSPVEYFNPFRTVQIDPSVNLEELAKVAHSLGEVVGLGLRNVAQCPIELNLMPKSILKKQQFNAKKPYFVATVASLALGLASMGWFYESKIVAAKQDKIAQLQAKVTPLQNLWDKKLSPVLQAIDTQLRASLLTTEKRLETRLQAKGARVGVWIEKLIPEVPGWQDAPTEVEEVVQRPAMSIEMMRRYGMMPKVEVAEAGPKKATNEIVNITLTCTAVNLQKYSADANDKLMEEVKSQLQSRTNLFAPDITRPDPSETTFNFEIALKLKRPIKT